MKIKYDSAELPSLIGRGSLTKEEKNLVALLENDEYFEKEITKIRKKFSIPRYGYKLQKVENQNKQWRKIIKKLNSDGGYKAFSNAVTKLRGEYLLPYQWQPSLEHFVIFNIFPLPLTYTSVGIYPGIYCDCDKNKPHWHQAKNYVLIGIEADVSMTEVTEWIKQNWPTIETQVSKLPRHLRPRFEITKLYERIVQLKEKEDYNYNQIAEKLYEENSNWIYTDNVIAILYSRYKKALHNLRTKA